jgi:hypothetical protein
VASGHDRTRAESLDDTGADQRLEVRRRAGRDARGREHHEADREQRRHVEPIRGASGKWHDRDVRDQIAVDDPGRLAQPRPVGEIAQDLRQCHGRDHQLDPDQEHAYAQRREQQQPSATRHRRSMWAR